jgi:hypothetical protein
MNLIISIFKFTKKRFIFYFQYIRFLLLAILVLNLIFNYKYIILQSNTLKESVCLCLKANFLNITATRSIRVYFDRVRLVEWAKYLKILWHSHFDQNFWAYKIKNEKLKMMMMIFLWYFYLCFKFYF